jgi:hypothetical protein
MEQGPSWEADCRWTTQIPRQGSSVSIMTRPRAGRPGLNSRQRQWWDSFRHHVQTDSGAHPASFTQGTRGFYAGDKAASAWSWPFASIYCRDEECVGLYLHSPVLLHGVDGRNTVTEMCKSLQDLSGDRSSENVHNFFGSIFLLQNVSFLFYNNN